MNIFRKVFAGVAVLPAMIIAAPMVSVDSANFDLGSIREGELNIAKHSCYVPIQKSIITRNFHFNFIQTKT